MFAAIALFATLASLPRALAIARPHHEHEDILDEEDLLIGFKLGPQVTTYTPIQTGMVSQGVAGSMGFQGGGTVEFVYGLPRFELDALWNGRGWVNTSNMVNSLSLPVLGKIPLQIDKGIDFEAGAGFEPDFVLFGADPHSQFMMGILASVGISVDFIQYVFNFEVRYNFGLNNVSTVYNGATNRDLQMLGGLLWHF